MGLDDLVPELAPFAHALVDAAGAAGLQPRITSTVRTRSEQARLYRRFLAGAAGFPVAPPGYSAHEYGEAFDMVTSPMEALADVGYTWQTWGGGWNPADAVHFELPGASDRARARGAATAPIGSVGSAVASLLEWIDSLPWYIQGFLPTKATILRDPVRYTRETLENILHQYGY
jgi:D-alanyl-D-alanine carboxypeptidase